MESIDPTQLNEFVRPVLSRYLVGNYQLDPDGQRHVVDANAQLDEAYAKANYLPVGDWCYRDIRRKLMFLPPREFGSLLDVCAGTGYVSLNVMRRGLFKKCVALDINPSALGILKKRAEDAGISGVETHVGNIFETHYADQAFDCVIGNAFLHHLPDTAGFFKEMCRILKPGGVLCLTCEPCMSSGKWENLIPRTVKRLMGKKHWPNGEVPLTDIWQFEQKALTKALRDAGFVETRIVGYGRWSSTIGTFLDRLWVRMTGYSAPSWLRYVGYILRATDFGPPPEQHPDAWAAISISARKGEV